MMPETRQEQPQISNGVPNANPDNAAVSGELSVREAVRRTLAELGDDAELDEVLAYLDTKFALTPPRGTVQTYLSLARKQRRDGAASEPRRRGRPRKANSNDPTLNPALDEVLDAVEILRDLSDRLGDENLRRLLDAL